MMLLLLMMMIGNNCGYMFDDDDSDVDDDNGNDYSLTAAITICHVLHQSLPNHFQHSRFCMMSWLIC